MERRREDTPTKCYTGARRGELAWGQFKLCSDISECGRLGDGDGG